MSASAPKMPHALTLGQAAEERALEALHVPKNTEVWRPSSEQIVTPTFQEIVGYARFTTKGLPRGTVLDSVAPSLAEIKSGASILDSSYQLRLQTFRSVVENQPLTIYTNRPVSPGFAQWLGTFGVRVKPLPPPPEP